MTDFLDEKRKEIETRLRELRPLVDEYGRLEKAAAALAGVGGGSARGGSARGGSAAGGGAPSGRSRRRRRGKATGAPRGRPRGSGKRAAQAHQIVSERPGITIPELADAMGIQANYLYRVMPTLQGEGKIRKDGKGWHPA